VLRSPTSSGYTAESAKSETEIYLVSHYGYANRVEQLCYELIMIHGHMTQV